MQTYNTISGIHNRIANTVDPVQLDNVRATAKKYFGSEPETLKELLSCCDAREKEMRRGTSDDLQPGESGPDMLSRIPKGWDCVTT